MWAERERQEKALNAQVISKTPALFPLRNPPLRAPLTLHRLCDLRTFTTPFPLTHFSARSVYRFI